MAHGVDTGGGAGGEVDVLFSGFLTLINYFKQSNGSNASSS